MQFWQWISTVAAFCILFIFVGSLISKYGKGSWLFCFSISCEQTVDLDIPNTTESYKLYSQVHVQFVSLFCCCTYSTFLNPHIVANVADWQRAVASDIKESVCRVPDTAFEGKFNLDHEWILYSSVRISYFDTCTRYIATASLLCICKWC